MKLFEMEGFLRGKCIPRDLMVNETNAEYLVRKFAEADARYAALAAELSAIEAIHSDAVFITDAHYEQCPPEVQKIIRALAVMQIPAYQAFLAEVRAQGVEMFAAHKRERQQALRSRSMRMSEEAAGMAADAENFADELRKGVQS
ncbi:hypothetical protein HA069_17425 [Escherichia coli]|uniref:hypothetical protein n=1 Tax=Escherichia coli TaxID=562 RepID=UPI00141222B3|nr:hypothetical protein [Escherichia coli]EMD5240860.1 hypothetical protein [Escherichia coli]NHV81975.1 hypothetical protein [Escherichia coli]HAW1957045.1 hypothetical protein [Escherichia coli]HAW1966815.1 hypothetical protein [Escherichia coli]HAW8324414.1 hypothetical protein [Escherichia coli]